MNTKELRQAYLDFFASKGHKRFSSDSLVPVGDASLLFTGAGMNQFKAYFLGQKKDVKRATSCQKCLRTADLDRVGKTAYHHTFFEMLGNFSFGDYFKEEAIAYGWEFVTKVLGISEDDLWVSVYEEDDEAFNIWNQKIGLPANKIVRMGAVDNFWPSNAKIDGPNGPCGPCSEIYVGRVPCKGVEIWNLVFTQFDRQSDGSLKPLPQKNIDTGMGLERTAAVLQGVESNFDIDLFQHIRAGLKELLKKGMHETRHENAVMDHARAVIFSIADGANPSNEGRGYVIRKLIRLGCDHLEKAGALERGLFHRMVPIVAHVMGDIYPEIRERGHEIAMTIQNEERAYNDILKNQVPKFRKELAATKSADIDKLVFVYYDTYGVPYDTLESICLELGVKLDKDRFESFMEEQRVRSRESSKLAGEIFAKDEMHSLTEGLPITQFLGYEVLSASGKLLRVIRVGQVAQRAETGEEVILIYDRSPFYAESGGQVGDIGSLISGAFSARVLDTQSYEKVILHKVLVEKGFAEVGQTHEMAVESARRQDIMKNHTATHLLHSALREVLGAHVKQGGSNVAPEALRFDFSHFKGMTPEEIRRVEDRVNSEIAKNVALTKRVMKKEEATREGAIAFFGEKYGDEVRVIAAGDFSKELCGGTHVNATGDIGLFKILTESSIQAGVRRIEAVTGRSAEKLVSDGLSELQELSRQFHVVAEPDPLKTALRSKSNLVSELKGELENKILSKMRHAYETRLGQAGHIGRVPFFVQREPLANADLFQKTFLHLKHAKNPFVVLWQCGGQDKVTFAVGCSDDLASKGFHAGKIVKEIALAVEGNGGGRPDFAVGGGKRSDEASLQKALGIGEQMIARSLSEMREG